MDTTLRHWHLLKLLPRYPRQTDAATVTNTLKSRGFGITKRTVERDLQSLSHAFPLQCDERSLPYGWSWAREGEPFDIPAMDAETALSFTVLDRFARHLLPANVTSRIDPHVQRARNVLRELTSTHGPRLWPERVRVLSRAFGLQAPGVDPAVVHVVYQALLEGRRFSGCYHSRANGNGDGREFEVNPLGLVFRDQVAYVVGTLWDYADVRQLALHRFTSAWLLDQACSEPDGFDLDAYIEAGHFHIRESGDSLRVHLRFSSDAAHHLTETPLAEDQEMRPGTDNRVDVRATLHDTAQFRWWLLGFGDAVEVMRPESLRMEIHDQLRRTLRHYED